MAQNYWQIRVPIPILIIVSMIWICVIFGSILFWNDMINPFSILIIVAISALIAWRWKTALSQSDKT